MRTYLTLLTAALLCMAAGAVVERCWSADKPAVDNDRLAALNKLLKEKLEVAEQRYTVVNASYQAGTASMDDVYAASIGLKNTAVEAAKSKEDRKVALERHRERMDELYKRVHAQFQAGRQGAETDKVMTARFWDLEAQVWVLEE